MMKNNNIQTSKSFADRLQPLMDVVNGQSQVSVSSDIRP